MCVVTNHVHYVIKINQAFLIFLVYIEKHGEAWVRGYLFPAHNTGIWRRGFALYCFYYVSVGQATKWHGLPKILVT